MWLPSHPSQGLMIKVCDNLVLYHIHNYIHYDFYIYDLSVLIFEREEDQSTRRKTLEAQERSTRPRLGLAFFSGERQRAYRMCHPCLLPDPMHSSTLNVSSGCSLGLIFLWLNICIHSGLGSRFIILYAWN